MNRTWIFDPAFNMTHRFIKNRDIILFSFQPWNSDIAFNFKDMAYELARYNRVLFIDRARDRNTVFKSLIAGEISGPASPDNLEIITEIFGYSIRNRFSSPGIGPRIIGFSIFLTGLIIKGWLQK